MEKFHLKAVFKNNGYHKNFVNLCIKKNLDKLFVKNKMSLKVPKLQFVCVLPYIRKSFLDLKIRLRSATKKNIPFCKHYAV